MGKKTNASLKTEKQKPMKEEEYLKLVERLKESEEFLRIGYEAGDLGIWKNDLQTGAIEFDERARIHYGFDTLHTTLSEVTNRIHPEDLARVGSEIESATSANGSGKFATEYRVIHPDGSIHWLAIGVRVLFEGEGVQRRALVGYGITQDITARKQVEIELHESEEKFEALFYQAAMPAVLLEISNRLAVDVNTAFENLSGYSREEIIGKNPVQIGMAPTAETQKAFHEFQEKGSLFGVEGRFFTKTGESRDILINANMVKLGGHEYALITYQNITERKQAEKQVIQMKRLYATLSQVNQTIVRVTDRTDLYQSICDVSTKFGEFALAWIGLLNEANGEVMPVAASGLDLAHWPFPQININEGIFKNGLIATALLTSKVVTSEDIVTDERTKSSQAALINHDYHAAAIVPFQLRGKTIGMLSLISHDANLFKQQDEVLLLKEMGGDISFALDAMETEIEHRQAEEKIKKQHDRLTILRKIDLAILSAGSLENIVRAALNHIRELIDCRRANLTLIDWKTSELVIFEVSTVGETSIPAGRRLPLAQFEDIIQILSKNQPIVFTDYRTIENPRPGIQSLIQEGFLSTCSLPLLSQGNLIGMLSMHSDLAGFFDEGKISLGSEVANQVAIAIIQMRLTEALAKSEERLRLSLYAAKQGLYDLNVQNGESIVNREYAEMLGYDPESFIETNAAWIERLHPDDKAITAKAYTDYINGLLPEYRVEFRQKTKQGDWKWILSLGSIVEYDAEGKPLRMMGTHTDINERKMAENQIVQMKRLYATLSQVNQTIVRVKDHADLYQSICDVSTQFGEFALAWIGILDSETGDIKPVATSGLDLSQWPFPQINIHEGPFKNGLIATAVLNSSVVTSDDIMLDERTSQSQTSLANYNYHATAIVPFQLRGATIGVLSLVSHDAKLFNAQEEILLLKEMGGDISFALDTMETEAERLQAETKVQEQLLRLRGLHTIDQAISTNSGMEETLKIILQQMKELLRIDAAAILLVDEQKQLLECAASQGFSSMEIRNAQLKLSEGYAGRAISERQTIHISNLLETGGVLAASLVRAGDDLLDYYGTPLISKGKVLGVVEIYFHMPITPDEDWLTFFEMVAGQAAIAIENSQLLDGLLRSTQELEQRVKMRTSDLQRVNTELEHANRTKDEFLANMSHELRTPLTGILGIAESLQLGTYGQLNEKQSSILNSIETSGRHLLELINDILDLSKVEAGKFDIYPEMIDIEETCRASLLFVKEQAAKKSILLEYQDTKYAKSVFADSRRLKQMLVNLLSNAVKFTPEKGQVNLIVHADSEKQQIHFTITDTGIGIAQDDLKHLFTPFTQVDSRLNRQYEGTGLGLVLVLRLAEMHGGNVQVESQVGTGSSFTISLPWHTEVIPSTQPSTVQTSAQPAIVSEPNSRGILLLVEDSPTNVETIGDYLQFKGYSVVVASNGMEALIKAEEVNPQLILMDIQMPVMDGLEATRRLRADSRFATTPIIALTALAMAGDREQCLSAGANDYLSKPVSLKELVGKIDKLLQKT